MNEFEVEEDYDPEHMKIGKGKIFDVYEFYLDVHPKNNYLMERTIRKIDFKLDDMEYEDRMKEKKTPKRIIKYRMEG
jgi:hypothetical protein